MAVLLVIILLYTHNPPPVGADTSTQGTQVGGRLRKNTIWGKENSPYVLVDDLTIPPDISLTISEGVTVDLSLWSMIIEGELRAVGTTDEKVHLNITLAPFKDSKRGRIYFKPTSPPYWDTYHGCKLQHVVITCSDYAVTYGVVEGGEPLMDDVKIVGGLSHYKEYAVKTNGTITNCVFDGVYMAVLMGDGKITDSTFLNTRHGTVIDINNGLVKDNVIDGGKRAIRVGNASIVDNTIMNMENVGINVQRDKTPYPFGKLKPRINGNIIVKCGEAIQIWGDTKPVITNNLIMENSHGVAFAENAFYGGAKPRIEKNAFYSNEYNVFMYREDPRVEVSVGGNWWGTDNTTVIEEKIHDEKDNPRLCKVFYEPILAQPPYPLPKVAYLISVDAPGQEIEITEKVVVSGSVTPPLETFNIVVMCVGPDGERTDASVSTGRDGFFNYEFTPGSVGLWQVSLSPQENVFIESSEADIQVNVIKMRSQLSLVVAPQICFEGDEVNFTGVLSPAIQDEVVEFMILRPDGSVSTGYSTTNAQGAFTRTSYGDALGEYRATFSWPGTQHYEGCAETFSYRVYMPGKLTVYVESEDGVQVEHAEIVSTAQPVGLATLKEESDSSGAAEFINLIYGNYTFNVGKDGYESATLHTALTEGEARYIKCLLTKEETTPAAPDAGSGDNSLSSRDPWYMGFIPTALTAAILATLYLVLHRLRR